MPEPSQASALASAGTERVPPTSAAMSLSATALIQDEPNAIAMMVSAAAATTQEALLSIDEEECNIQREPGGRSLLQALQELTSYAPASGLPRMLQCAKNLRRWLEPEWISVSAILRVPRS